VWVIIAFLVLLAVFWPWMVGWPHWLEWLVSLLWWCSLAAVAVIVMASRVRRESHLRAAGLPEIDRMTGEQFEKRVVRLLADLGHRVRHTGRSGDFGCDIVATISGTRTVVQVKRYAKPVGVTAIQEAHTARAHYHAYRAVVVTNGRFTPHARQLARETGVQCWDRPVLGSLLMQALVRRRKASGQAIDRVTRPPDQDAL
jgi:hypothetical protein